MKRRLETGKSSSSRGAQLPSEKVSIWHRDIFMVTPRRMKGMRGAGGSGGGGSREHPRSCVCPTCLAQYGTYRYYRRAMHERRAGRGNSTSSGVNLCILFSTHVLPNLHIGNNGWVFSKKGNIVQYFAIIFSHQKYLVHNGLLHKYISEKYNIQKPRNRNRNPQHSVQTICLKDIKYWIVRGSWP